MFSRTTRKRTKRTKTSLLGPKRWIGCVRFVSGPKLCIVSLTGRTRALNATRHGFSHSNETDQNEPKHHYWVLKRWIGCVRFVSGPKLCIVSLKGRTGALNASPAVFLAQYQN